MRMQKDLDINIEKYSLQREKLNKNQSLPKKAGELMST